MNTLRFNIGFSEKRLIHKTRWEGSFGQTWADNSIHFQNNEGLYDHTVGAVAAGARQFGKLGNDSIAFITGKEKRPAYEGIYGQTRADVVETLSTIPRLFTEKNKLGTLANGVTSLFDIVYDATITDPLTLAAGDHANKPRLSTTQSNILEEQTTARKQVSNIQLPA